jgi:hypothetical protein
MKRGRGETGALSEANSEDSGGAALPDKFELVICIDEINFRTCEKVVNAGRLTRFGKCLTRISTWKKCPSCLIEVHIMEYDEETEMTWYQLCTYYC